MSNPAPTFAVDARECQPGRVGAVKVVFTCVVGVGIEDATTVTIKARQHAPNQIWMVALNAVITYGDDDTFTTCLAG